MALSERVRAKIGDSTQDHLEVYDIVENMVITRSGSAAYVIQTNAVNFDLLSEQEQDNKIYAFAGLLNSLNFHIQILIKTKRIDITNYINYLKAQDTQNMTDGLRKQLEIYTEFVQNLIVTNDVLDKKFYIVIPYHPSGFSSGASLKKQKEADTVLTTTQKARVTEQGKIFLQPKLDQILKLVGRMGLVGHHLTNEELINLFYDMYNPEE